MRSRVRDENRATLGKKAKETFSLSTDQLGIAFRWRLHVLRAILGRVLHVHRQMHIQ